MRAYGAYSMLYQYGGYVGPLESNLYAAGDATCLGSTRVEVALADPANLATTVSGLPFAGLGAWPHLLAAEKK